MRLYERRTGMSSTARLVIRSIPRRGESLLGFLLRVSDANRYSGVGALSRLAHLPRTFLSRPCALQDLTSVLGDVVSSKQIEQWSYWRASPKKGVTFGETTVSTVDINLIHPKVCPACLEESGIARQAWDLRVVTTCWRHGCYLVDHCSECSSRLTWGRKRLLQCDCGSQFTKQPVGCAPAEAIAFTLVLEAFLINGNTWVDPFPVPVRSLSAICRVIWWFGVELAKPENAQRLAITKPSVCVGAKIVERGNNFVENWPSSIQELLIEPQPSASTAQARSPEHVLYKMRHAFGGAEFVRMFDDVRRWLGDIGYPVKPNSFYSIRQAMS